MASIRSTGTVSATASNVATPTTLTPGLPATRVNGDMLLCFTACRSTTPTVATPAGWTKISEHATATAGRMVVFARPVDGSESAPSVTWSGLTTGNAGTPAMARVACVNGLQASTTGLVDVDGADHATTSATVGDAGAAITTLTANDLVFAFTNRQDDVGTWGLIATADGITWAQVFGAPDASTSGSDMSMGVQWGVKATAGAVAAKTFAITSGISFPSSGYMLALKPLVSTTWDGAATLAATAVTLAVSGTVEKVGSATLAAGAVTLAAAGTTEKVGSATLAATPVALSVAGERTAIAAATLAAGAVTLSAAGTAEKVGAVTLAAGAITLAAAGEREASGAAVLAATSPALTVTAVRESVGAATLVTTSPALEVAAVKELVGSATLAAPVVIAADSVRDANAAATLSNPVTLDAAAAREAVGAATLAIATTIDASANRDTFGAAVLPLLVSFDVTGTIDGVVTTWDGEAVLPFTVNLSAAAQRDAIASATLHFTPDMGEVAAVREAVGAAVLSNSVTLAADPVADLFGAAVLSINLGLVASAVVEQLHPPVPPTQDELGTDLRAGWEPLSSWVRTRQQGARSHRGFGPIPPHGAR